MQKDVFSLEVITCAKETNDSTFVLLYAFYKDFCNSHRLRIPTYAVMYKAFTPLRDESYIFIASHENIPVGMLWLVKEEDTIVIHALGGTIEGMAQKVDRYLLTEVVRWGSREGTSAFLLRDETDFPHPGHRERKEIFHSILRDHQDALHG